MRHSAACPAVEGFCGAAYQAEPGYQLERFGCGSAALRGRPSASAEFSAPLDCLKAAWEAAGGPRGCL